MSICRPTCLLGLISLMFAAPVAAQIVPDSSVGTTITPNVEIKGVMSEVIDGGTIRGANLFHSFSEFNIQNGRGAYFTNPEGITNIFSRITGNNPSNLNGVLGVLGNANLFLLNPNGIIFGPNAKLDLNGSFFGTTANSIRFADGVEFSATDPSAAPLLTINVPVGLQMGSNPGAITVQGSGHNIAAANPVFSPYVLAQPNSELKVQTGNTIALVGGDINLEGGVLTAQSGRIDLTAIDNNLSEPPIVTLSKTSSGWSVNSVELGQLGDISLSQESLVDASGIGSIQLQGRNISLSNGSLVLIQNTTSAAAGDITIRAAEGLQLDGMSTDGKIRSGLENQTLAAGNSGGIQVFASDVMINNGAAIFTRSFSSGTMGDIIVNASGAIQAAGFYQLNPRSNANSFIGSFAFGLGDSGSIAVSAQELTLLDAGGVSTSTFGAGNAGQLNVDVANSIELSGFNPFSRNVAILSSASFGAGNAGNSRVQARQIRLSNSGRISTGGFSTGDAGNVIVNASELIEISGETSLITSSAIILDQVTRRVFRLPEIPSGDAGSVTVNTPILKLEDEGAVSVRNEGVGNAGSLQINAHRIELNRQGAISASTASGEGGNITLQTQNLQLRNSSSITATSGGSGNGGNITIDSPTIVGLENSDIVANAFQGNGGNIQINTQGIFGLENRPELTPESDISASSQFGVSGTINVSVLNVNQQNVVEPPPSNFVSPDRLVASSCLSRQGNSQGTLAIAGNGGLPETHETGTLPYEVVQVQSASTGSAPSNVEPSPATTSWKWGDPIVEATEFSVNAQGQVVLIAKRNSAAGAISHPQPLPCQSN